MSVIQCLVANTGVQVVMIIVVKIIGDAGFRVGQVGKNRQPAQFEHVRFEPGPKTFHLRIVVTVARPDTTATALRAQDLVLME